MTRVLILDDDPFRHACFAKMLPDCERVHVKTEIIDQMDEMISASPIPLFSILYGPLPASQRGKNAIGR